jgi:hypothetical protein
MTTIIDGSTGVTFPVTAGGTSAVQASSSKVLQIVTVNKTDTFSMSSGTWTDVTGLSASITPSSSSSKILVLASVAIGGADNFGYIRLIRGSTVIDVGDAASNRPQVTGALVYPYNPPVYSLTQIPVTYLDSPATTSATTYKIQLRWGTSGTVYINRTASDRDTTDYEWRTPSNIVLMEIAA